MKHILLFLFGAIIFAELHAQPVLDLTNSAPVPGESFVLHACAWQSPGNAGASQTWDLSALTTDSLVNLEFVDPSTTPDGIFFPAATVAVLDPAGNVYSKFDANEGNLVGISQPGAQPIVYSEPMMRAVFPCTYMTTWTDSLHAAYVLGGYTFQRIGHITATADAYGTLIMPNGQLDNVLRVTYVEDYSDHSLLTANYHREYTQFLLPGTHCPVVNLFSYSVTVLNNTQTAIGCQWLEVPTASIEENNAGSSMLSVWPVPAKEEMRVRFNSHASTCALDLIDALGQIAMHRDVITPNTGTCEEHVSLTGLRPALYTLRIRQNGAETSQRIIVQ